MIVPVVKIQRICPSSGPLPRYQSEQAAGLDLTADLDGTLTLTPLARAAIPTGIAVEIPPGFEGQVRPRSGRALEEGLALVNSPGTIDADYRGEIKVIAINLGDRPIVIKSGDRIAQDDHLRCSWTCCRTRLAIRSWTSVREPAWRR